jgi:predicted transcriptional regulator
MRTTIDLPDDLFRRAKAIAALRGATLKDLVTDALRAFLAREAGEETELKGWRRHFGVLSSPEDREELARIDARIEEAFEQIDPEDLE